MSDEEVHQLLHALRRLFGHQPPRFTDEEKRLYPKGYSWANVRCPGLYPLLADVEKLLPPVCRYCAELVGRSHGRGCRFVLAGAETVENRDCYPDQIACRSCGEPAGRSHGRGCFFWEPDGGATTPVPRTDVSLERFR